MLAVVKKKSLSKPQCFSGIEMGAGVTQALLAALQVIREHTEWGTECFELDEVESLIPGPGGYSRTFLLINHEGEYTDDILVCVYAMGEDWTPVWAIAASDKRTARKDSSGRKAALDYFVFTPTGIEDATALVKAAFAALNELKWTCKQSSIDATKSNDMATVAYCDPDHYEVRIPLVEGAFVIVQIYRRGFTYEKAGVAVQIPVIASLGCRAAKATIFGQVTTSFSCTTSTGVWKKDEVGGVQ